MGLMDAQEYDPRPAQRRIRLVIVAVLVVVVAGILWYFLRFWPEERVIDKFFEAVERNDMQTAYGIYMGDPNWQQHSDQYSRYPFGQFGLDYGPSGDYGKITAHHLECATNPPKRGDATPTGVIVVVRINNRAETKSMWVEKKTKTITDSPDTVLCHGDH